MGENDNNFENRRSLDEIIRLQEEIKRDLTAISEGAASKPPTTSADSYDIPQDSFAERHDMPAATHLEDGDMPLDAPLETSDIPAVTSSETDDIQATYPGEYGGATIPAILEFPSDSPQKENFYKETVRSDRVKNRKERFKRVVALVLVAAIAGGTAIGGAYAIISPLVASGYFSPNKEVYYEPKEFTFGEPKDIVTEMSIIPAQEGYADLIAAVEPSVVCIYSRGTATRDFFGNDIPGESSGSGIIFSEDETKCYIATNAHVISGMQEVSVCVSSAEGVQAKLVGKDVDADIAVISILKNDLSKVGINKLTISNFGDSDMMRVGDVVLAIGNALGEGNTATNGILSAKDKEITTNASPTSLKVIQTNAAINPGNSGGPLINSKGEVIGITTAKTFETRVEGMGYAIPSNIVKQKIQELMNSSSKPRLGVTVQTITEDLSKQMNLQAPGALVMSVVAGGPAEKAGIQMYDIITGVDGAPVFEVDDLLNALSEKKVGDVVEIKLIRNGKDFLTVNVKLAALDDQNF